MSRALRVLRGENGRVIEQRSLKGWLRRAWREWDWEFSVKRTLLLLIAGPTGALLGGAAAASEMGGRWWLWLGGAIAWLVVSALGSVAVLVVLFYRRGTHARRR